MILDMTLGMILGMIASPLMMKGIKILRQRNKVNKILKEVAESIKNGQVSDTN